MLSNSRIKFIRSLRLTKFRREEGLFVIEGDKLVREALDKSTNPDFKIHSLYATSEWFRLNSSTYPIGSIDNHQVGNKELKQISSQKTPNMVLALVEKKNHDINNISFEDGPVLYLDQIQDPGNMGTIIRIADWFGLKTIICSNNCVDHLSLKVVQATMGSIFRVAVMEAELDRWIGKIKDQVPIYGTLLEGKNIYSEKFDRKGIIILGNESNGIRPEFYRFITNKISIPRIKREGPGPESLNVSIACGIILSEFFRGS
jgi:TrmH family RNA methyltransferase